MEFIINYWYVFVGVIAVIIMAGFAVYKFAGLPTKEQMIKVKEWLKYAVSIAEKELGEKTGQLKLRMVYDMMLTKFPVTARLISFQTFSLCVDEALEWLDKQLSANENIANIIAPKTE